jgi:hypothetical protein
MIIEADEHEAVLPAATPYQGSGGLKEIGQQES